MVEALKKSYNFVLFVIEEMIPALLVMTIIIALVIQVFMRYFFRISLTTTYELSLYGYLWLLYLGASYARRKKKHIRLDIIYEMFSVRWQKIIDIIFNIIVIAILARLFWPVWDYIWFLRRLRTYALNLNWTLAFFPFIAFFALIIIHNVEFVVKDIIYLIKNKQGS